MSNTMNPYYRVEYYNNSIKHKGEIESYTIEEALEKAKGVKLLPEMSEVHVYRMEEVEIK